MNRTGGASFILHPADLRSQTVTLHTGISDMPDKTINNLYSAFVGEAKAHFRLLA